MTWNSDCRQHPHFGKVEFEEYPDAHAAIEASLRHDLAGAIAQHRGGRDAGRLADVLLGWSYEGLTIIGLIDDCECVVRYGGGKAISAIPFDLEGIQFDDSEFLGLHRQQDCPAFVRAQGVDYWDWVHPQYRWVFEF